MCLSCRIFQLCVGKSERQKNMHYANKCTHYTRPIDQIEPPPKNPGARVFPQVEPKNDIERLTTVEVSVLAHTYKNTRTQHTKTTPNRTLHT